MLVTLFFPFWSPTSTILFKRRRAQTSQRCHQHRNFVTDIPKSWPTLSQQHHHVTNITVIIFTLSNTWKMKLFQNRAKQSNVVQPWTKWYTLIRSNPKLKALLCESIIYLMPHSNVVPSFILIHFFMFRGSRIEKVRSEIQWFRESWGYPVLMNRTSSSCRLKAIWKIGQSENIKSQRMSLYYLKYGPYSLGHIVLVIYCIVHRIKCNSK